MELIFKAPDAKKTYKVTKLYVEEGGRFQESDLILKAENGKANTMMKAERAGTVEKLWVSAGQEIGDGYVCAQVNYEENATGPEAARAADVRAADTRAAEAGPKEAGPKAAGIRAVDTRAAEAGTKAAGPAAPDSAAGKKKPDLSIFGKTEKIACDIAVIGAGPGGYEAAIYAAKHGKQVVLIEKDKVGGTCLNVGCIPTKAIVNSAEKYRMLSHLHSIGVDAERPSYDMHRVMAHKNQVVETLRNGVESLLEANGVRRIKGTASFQSNERIVAVQGLNRCEIDAANVIIATGSSIAKLPIPGIDGKYVLNSTSALSLEEDFDSIAVIGGGVIGMEFAGIYSSFGKEVHVLEYESRILPMIDEDLTEVLAEDMRGDVDIQTGVRVKEIKESENGRGIVVFEKNGRDKYLVVDRVLAAVGRVANLSGLHLEKTDIRLTENGRNIQIDDHMETSVPGIYAIGDVTGKIQLAHAASHQGIIAVDNILGKSHTMDYSQVPSVIFSRVEIAAVGKSETELRKEGQEYKVSRFPFAANGKALSMDETAGFIKLMSRKEDGKLIGAAVVGPDASNLISILCVALANGLTADGLTRTVFPHPTLGEVVHEAGLGLSIGAIHFHE